MISGNLPEDESISSMTNLVHTKPTITIKSFPLELVLLILLHITDSKGDYSMISITPPLQTRYVHSAWSTELLLLIGE